MTNSSNEDNLSEYLGRLVAEACLYPAKSLQRRQILTKIYRVVTNSGRLWRRQTPYYQEALQETWKYFCVNPESYDPKRASLITWLSSYLKWRLIDFDLEQARSQATMASARRSRYEETDDLINRIDEQPAPPDIPLLLEEIRDWAQTDADGELRNTIFRRRPEINAQALILQRLPPETPWRTLAENFQLNPAEAKDLPKFYSRRCLPLLRIFGLKQGYIDRE